jgi:hypothetical protein
MYGVTGAPVARNRKNSTTAVAAYAEPFTADKKKQEGSGTVVM